MNFTQQLKHEIIGLVHSATKMRLDIGIIATPPKPEMGDFALPVFAIASAQKKNPVVVAQELAQQFECPWFSKIVAVGPYVNFYTNIAKLATDVLTHTAKPKEVGVIETFKGKKVMVEYFSPNTNKPMTVGHLRNLTLGATLARLYKKSGAKVLQATLFNDRGIAIAKSMLAYDKFGNKISPQKAGKKSDLFVGDFYVMFGREAEKNPALEQEAQEYVRLWESGDKRIRSLWQKLNTWVYMGYRETLEKLHEGNFDSMYYESDFYDKAKEIVYKNLGKGVIKQSDDGMIYADLESVNLPNKILLRNDGTSLYITQDLYLAGLKAKKNIDISLYVIGDEQDLQMKQLFAILRTLDTDISNYHHVSYGMMRLPDGKIKSREGFGRALADGLIHDLEHLAKTEIGLRNPTLPQKKIEVIANQIMNAALKFYILNIDPKKTMVFDPKEAVSFTGKTGPYLQYTVVRLTSILKQVSVPKKFDPSVLVLEEERQLISHLANYETIIAQSLEHHAPSILTSYLYELSQLVNRYYHDVSLLKSPKKEQGARAALVKSIITVLTDGLAICGIEVPEKM